MNLGLSGRLTEASIASKLTPLALFTALALGLIALMVIPREEEPQISVPMIDIHVQANGLKTDDAVELVTKPLEAIVKAIPGVEHVYSQTVDDHVTVTARFMVGTSADAAILRVHERIRANYDRIPAGIPEPLIVGRGIDDVAIFIVTLAPNAADADRWTAPPFGAWPTNCAQNWRRRRTWASATSSAAPRSRSASSPIPRNSRSTA